MKTDFQQPEYSLPKTEPAIAISGGYRPLQVLIACEESQAVCLEFRKLGHIAFSCDIQECSGGFPEWHLQGDVFDFLKQDWDLLIAFPPCTHLSSAGAVYWPQKQIDGRQNSAIEFVKKLWNSGIKNICIENPSGILSTVWMKPTQIIHPFHFGDPYKKHTCFWLKNLPALQIKNNLFFNDENIVEPIASWHSGSTRGGIKKDGTRTKAKLPALHGSSKMRSKTFPSVAKAMASQWSVAVLSNGL